MNDTDASAHRPRIEPIPVELREPLKAKMAKIFPEALPSPVLYRTVARNQSLFIDLIDQRLIGPTGLLDRKSVPPRTRELLILRTCVAARNDYELNLHVRTISEAMGLSKEEIADVQKPVVDASSWSPSDRALIALIDGLVDGVDVEDTVYENAREHFGEDELIELTLLVGLYTAVSMVVALARPERDPY